MDQLTDTEQEMLDLEASWFKYAGARAEVIRDRFDCSTVVYAQRLLALIERPEALAHAPQTVRRLQRLRERRRRGRSGQLVALD